MARRPRGGCSACAAGDREPASRGQMALRQASGLLFNGEFLVGVFILLIEQGQTSVSDYLIGTVVLHVPHHALLT
jgi:hypothetical protein